MHPEVRLGGGGAAEIVCDACTGQGDGDERVGERVTKKTSQCGVGIAAAAHDSNPSRSP